MIRRLRARMTALVILGLALISIGIVFSIDYANRRTIEKDAFVSLDILMENGGRRRGSRIQPPWGAAQGEQDLPWREQEGETSSLPQGERRWRFSGRGISDEMVVDLSNFFSVRLDEKGEILSYETDREDLYTEEDIKSIAALALARGGDRGSLGTEYYAVRNEENGERLMVVLDARLDVENARQVLRITALVALCAWALLSLGAFFLIRRMVRPVEEAFEKQKRFVWDASHELKTPMAVISAHAELLRRENGDSESVQYILSEVQRADQLVKNLLSLARLEKGQAAPEMADFDLSDALMSVILPFESTVFEAGRTLETQIPDGVRLYGQEDMIRQLAVILLSNALKYSNEGGVIRVTLEIRGKARQLTVFNTGEGIAPENREKVFDRFFREDTSHSREVEGSGLGLSIARAIVQTHRGKITAGGVWHENAVFTVILPNHP